MPKRNPRFIDSWNLFIGKDSYGSEAKPTTLPRERARASERKRTRNRNIKISGHRYLINHSKDIARVDNS